MKLKYRSKDRMVVPEVYGNHLMYFRDSLRFILKSQYTIINQFGDHRRLFRKLHFVI